MGPRLRNRRAARMGVGLLTLALLTAACGGDDDDSGSSASGGSDASSDAASQESEEYQALLEQANEEGSVVLYSSGNPTAMEDLGDAFGEAYPDIQFEFLRESSAVLQDRIAGERDAGQVGGDVVLTSNRFWAEEEASAGRLAPLQLSAENEPYAADCVSSDGIALTGTDVVGLVYNTGIIEDPQSLDDFVGEPGGFNNPDTSATVIFIADTIGFDFLEEVADSGESFTYNEGAPEAIAAVTAGEQAWGLANVSQAAPVRADGAPIDVFLSTPTPGFNIATVPLADSPHPAAAQILVNFMLSQEGQQVLNDDGGGISCRDDVEGTLDPPEDLVLFSPEHVADDYVAEGKARFAELFG